MKLLFLIIIKILHNVIVTLHPKEIALKFDFLLKSGTSKYT